MRRTILAVTILCIARCFGQTPAAPLAFEVASVKVSKAPPGSDSSHSTLGSLTMRNMTLRACIGMAYNVKELQVLGGPKWLDADRYDIDAKPAGAVQAPERMAMLQTLLAERFQLALHRETKTYPGYALVVSKAGLKMHAVEPGQSNLSTHNSSMTGKGVNGEPGGKPIQAVGVSGGRCDRGKGRLRFQVGIAAARQPHRAH